MPTLEQNKKSLLERGKDLRQKVEYNNFLRNLVSVYSSPFLEPKYDYSEVLASRKAAEAQKLSDRFDIDRKTIVSNMVSLLGDQSLESLCKKVSPSEVESTLLKALCLILNFHQEISFLPSEIDKLLENFSPENPPTATRELNKANLVRCVLDVVIDRPRIPRFFEINYVGDIVHIIKSRYADQTEKHWDRSNLILNTLKIMLSCPIESNHNELPLKIEACLGPDHEYFPVIGQAHSDIKMTIPELFDELINIKAKDNLSRFLEINKEYSFRQREYHKARGGGNPWGLPLIAGLEEDHHVMLRTLIKLRNSGRLSREDEVLVVGPRYVDELTFFRKHLDLPKTVGLDLFADPEEGIVAGDMHQTDFENNKFSLIFCAGTLAYAYDLRKVVKEFTRILKKPGFLCLMDAGDRVNGVDPLGRSDPMGLEAMISCFYEHTYEVHAKDCGRTPLPSMFKWWPCVVLEIKD